MSTADNGFSQLPPSLQAQEIALDAEVGNQQKRGRVEEGNSAIKIFKNPKNSQKDLRNLYPFESPTEYADRSKVSIPSAIDVMRGTYIARDAAKTDLERRNLSAGLSRIRKIGRSVVARIAANKSGEQLYVPLKAKMTVGKLKEIRDRIAARKEVNKKLDLAKGITGFRTTDEASQYISADPEYANTYRMKPARGKEWKAYQDYKVGDHAINRPFYMQNGTLVGGPWIVPQTVEVDNVQCVALPKMTMDDKHMTRAVATYINPFAAIPKRRVLYKVGYFPQE